MQKSLAARLIKSLVALDVRIAKLGGLVEGIADPDQRRGYIQAVRALKGHVFGKLMIPILRGYPDLDPDKSRREQPVGARKVVIQECPYFCYQDEKHFFEWLESIRGVQEVTGGPDGLTVHFARAPLSYESWADLLGVFARYGLDMHPLRVLVDKRHEAWLRDPEKFWHAAMWSDAKRRPVIDLLKTWRRAARAARSKR